MNPTLQKLTTLKVLVAVPSMGVWVEGFGTSLCNMLTHFQANKVGLYKRQVVFTESIKGSILPKSRWRALRHAKESGVDYLLFVDSDQTFPRETLNNLIMRNRDVVAANIATKTMPTLPTARGKPSADDPKHGKLVYTDVDSRGLEQVWRIGCGIMLLSKKAIQALPPTCFDIKYRADADDMQGEDWTLCEALEALGIDIWIDHDLSNRVGHIGSFNYTHEYNGEVQHGSEKIEGQRDEGGGLVLRSDLRGIQAESVPGSAGQGCGGDQGSGDRREGAGPGDGDSEKAVAGGEVGQ